MWDLRGKDAVKKSQLWENHYKEHFYDLKSDFTFQKCFISLNESPLKMMKNAFYFTLKTFFVLQKFKFLIWLLVMQKQRLD